MIRKKRVSRIDTPYTRCTFLYDVDASFGRPLSAKVFPYRLYFLLKFYEKIYNTILWKIFA